MTMLPSAQEKLCFQSSVGKLSHDPEGFLRLVWSCERQPLEAIKAFYEQVLTLLRATGTRKILSNHGHRPPLTGAAQQWLIGDWIPRAIAQTRLSHCAIVDGADPLHRLSVQSVMLNAPAGFILRRFPTIEAAYDWLVSVR
ncbi:hypothetical protein [Hymenobacter terrenus]|uniref:hypothetical protein n=1 Tax=Hymenobacter terrenus TaxID=1629124 RepID=UPI000AF63F80|nr:hypothetical protein [Hymenobacter terrenus]